MPCLHIVSHILDTGPTFPWVSIRAEWFLSLPESVTSTKSLTEAQATTLMDTIASWDDDTIAQSLAEFREWSDEKAPF